MITTWQQKKTKQDYRIQNIILKLSTYNFLEFSRYLTNEIIVVDDGSTDSTAKIASKFPLNISQA